MSERKFDRAAVREKLGPDFDPDNMKQVASALLQIAHLLHQLHGLLGVLGYADLDEAVADGEHLVLDRLESFPEGERLLQVMDEAEASGAPAAPPPPPGTTLH